MTLCYGVYIRHPSTERQRGLRHTPMPTQPIRYCMAGGSTCAHKVSASQPCPIHSRNKNNGWVSGQKRIRGRKLQNLRVELFSNEPFCRVCAAKGLTVIADIRDHIIPVAEGGTEDPRNIQPLCHECSDAKTRDESRRGCARR